jgi:hypothetical protein
MSDFLDLISGLVLIAFVIIGLIVQGLLVLGACAPQGRSFGKAVVATLAWLAISFTLFSIFFLWGFGVGFTGRGQIPFVVIFLAGTFAYSYVGKRLCAWVGGDQAN